MGKNKKKSKSSSADLKVVYISSPMKVKTCASNFRSTVQQLTGRDSDLVDRLMDEYANNSTININNVVDVSNEILMLEAAENSETRRVVEIPETTISNNSFESPTSSESMAFDVADGLMFSDAVGGGGGGEGFDTGFSFEEIFGAGGFLLECPVDEAGQFC